MSEVTKITGGKQPAILTVMADEEVTGTGEPPAMSTLADVVLILDDVVDRPPYFHNKKYIISRTRCLTVFVLVITVLLLPIGILLVVTYLNFKIYTIIF